jgi:acyl carrier protein
MKNDLKKLLASALEVSESEITEDSNMDTIGNWDSLKHIELMVMLEDKYEIILETEEMIVMTSFQNIMNILSNKNIS